jgi:hypothetical protein
MKSRRTSRALRFLPLAFLAGTHGFALFAPYVAVVLAALHLRTRHRQRSRDKALLDAASSGAPVPLPVGEAGFEPVPA